jgi:hypothetical protein
MYWQPIFAQKTSLVAELILTRILKRAKDFKRSEILPCSGPLQFLAKQNNLRHTDTGNLDLFFPASMRYHKCP